jgi:hypothetical protein
MFSSSYLKAEGTSRQAPFGPTRTAPPTCACRVAIIGQQAFGKSVCEAFRGRGDTVAGVFCAPEKPGARPDPLRQAAEAASVPVFQLPALKGVEAETRLRALDVDLAIMAYVLQFAPQTFVNIPRHGTIQYHPSLLPRHRGPSSINWPLIMGATQTSRADIPRPHKRKPSRPTKAGAIGSGQPPWRWRARRPPEA